MGLYLEDLEVGRCYEGAAYPVTEEEMARYAAVCRDPNPLHTDPVFCRETPLGRPTANGMFLAGLLVGMAMDSLVSGTAVKLLAVRSTFPTPAFAGDCLRGEFVPRSTLPSSQNPARGTLDLLCRLRNGAGDVVAECLLDILMETRAAAGR